MSKDEEVWARFPIGKTVAIPSEDESGFPKVHLRSMRPDSTLCGVVILEDDSFPDYRRRYSVTSRTACGTCLGRFTDLTTEDLVAWWYR